ncbi:NAD(P)-binding protein [Macroventuria anomochaeta]|uniref:NAD(P)-binding protein n=1 Tax=Macroventuria anomochaeta TaxID=301207 RepID=A0ACB6RUE2_9PLEO|nr:NAD(P)-binding protein [Macroventuria anomochaeta]KAF2625030.1 NAD(P)-binding protein [Macroventuria anomochaeta]
MTHPAPTQIATRDLFRLDGRTILVSGGAGAVGTIVGKAILESGGDVVFLDLMPQMPEDKWRDVLASTEVSNAEARYQQLNVQDEATIMAAMDQIRTGLRRPIRGLVTCAAISGESDACDYSVSTFRQILDVNMTGTFLITRTVANEMHRANVTGSIVLIASISGHVSNRGINSSAYNASKAAVHQLARSFAAEWGHPQNTFPGSTKTETNPHPSTEPRRVYPPIRVNTLSPGHIDTPLSEAARVRGLTDEWANQNMLGRISQPEEYRAPVLFLLSEGSSYMTGADLRVDGGHCAW